MDNTEVSRYWNESAPAWVSQVRMGYDFYRERINNPHIFALIGNLKGKDIIDLGCGEGYNTRKLALEATSVCGIDIPANMIDLARSSEQQEPLGIRYEVASFTNLPMFPDNTFDLAVSFVALMDGADFASAVAEAFRVLKPGGVLAFSILPPCFATPALDWLSNQHGEKDRLTVGQYFEGTTIVEEWLFSKSSVAAEYPPFHVPRFQRTRSDYLNSLCENGFRIDRVQEPRPDESACREYPAMEKWRRHAALFLHVKSTKSQEEGAAR